MFTHTSTRKAIAAIIVIGMLFGFAACYAWTDDSHAGHQRAPTDHSHSDHDHTGHNGHHGGQMSNTVNYCFEVVYRPQEMRIYLYDHDQKHLSMRGVSGQATMQIRGSDQVYRLPLQYVAAKGSADHDYLSLSVDVRSIRDGDMKVTFGLENLPSAPERAASFTQTFALSTNDVIVTVAPLTDADRTGIARQAVCPVMGKQLGSHGTPIKLMVEDQPMYVCCKSCISRVRKEPRIYLPNAAARGN